MYPMIGRQSHIINQKMKLMYITVILCLLGKIVLYETVYITYKYEIHEYDVLCNNFFSTVLRMFFLLNSVKNYTLKYLLKSFQIELITSFALLFILFVNL